MKLTLAKSSHAKGGGEGLWAISYADFLMVLLSFFIIFFSLEKNDSKSESKSVLSKLAINFNEVSEGAKSGIRKISEPTAVSLGNKVVINDLSTKFKDSQSIVVPDEEKIIINLPDNIYRAGEFEVTKPILDKVLLKFEGLQEKIQITVVGYSDDVKFASKGRRVVNENFTLAAVRASYAAKYIKNKLPNFKVNTHIDENMARNTRSISLVISTLKEKSK